MGCGPLSILSNTMNESIIFSHIPNEVLVHIVSFLDAPDICNLALTCKDFRRIVNVESGWIKRCQRQFGIPLESIGTQRSCKLLYTKFLYKYRNLFGLWQIDFKPYGGLLRVHFDRGKIHGTELAAPTRLNEPLRERPLFMISCDEKYNIRTHCMVKRYSSCDHPTSIIMRNGHSFGFRCDDTSLHIHPEGKDRALFYWIQEETGAHSLQEVSELYDILLLKYITTTNRNLRYECTHLRLSTSHPRNCPIKPGMFKGTYGSHGIELVNLSYSDCGGSAIVTKISGDSNVPYRKDSFRASLNHPLILTAEDQETILKLVQAATVGTKIPLDQLPTQPFVVPRDCVERMTLPNTCNARFRASGQVAGIGYLNPSFTDGHWIIFNEDLFGYLWLELLLLSAFERVKDVTS